MLFTLDVEGTKGNVRRTTLFSTQEWGDWDQIVLVAAEEWGPFDTDTDISRWVWKWVARALADRGVGA